MANTVVWLAIAILATWRIAHAISVEDGPWDAFSRLQAYLGGGKNWISRGLSCPLCTGVWLSLAIVIIAMPLLPIVDWRSFVLIWGSIAGGQAVIQKVVG